MALKTLYKQSAALALFLCTLCSVAGCSDGSPSGYTEKGDLEFHITPGSLSGTGTRGQLFFAKGTASGKYTEKWKSTVDQDGRVLLDEPKYYPEDNSRVYLRGFFPEGKSFDKGKVHYQIDGTQDLIASGEQSGCLTDVFLQKHKEFRFTHLLSQLRFKVSCDKDAIEKGWKLVNLYVERTQSEVALSLADKELIFSGEKGTMEVPVEPTPLAETWTDLSGRVLVQPGVRIFLTAVIADSGGRKTRLEYLPVTFEGGNTPVGGTSYLISLMLGAKGTSILTGGIAEWVQGGNGSTVL